MRRCAVVAGVLGALVVVAPVAAADEPKPGEVVVVAGTGKEGYTGDGFAAKDARIGGHGGVTVAPDGTVFLADSANRRVRVISTDGKIDTLPGTVARRSPERDIDYDNGWIYSPSNVPHATAVGPDGALYVAGNDMIGRWQSNGTLAVLAGGGEASFEDGGNGGDGGPATAARFNQPIDLAVDAAGNLYLADKYDNRIRKITPDGIIHTIAGGGTRQPEQADGAPATELLIDEPQSVAVDSAGNLYFTLFMGPVVGKVAPDGTFTLVTGGEPQTGSRHGGIAVDSADNVYFSDVGNGAVRMVAPDGTITSVGPVPGHNDLAVGPDGDLYMMGEAVLHRYVRHGKPADERQPVRRESRWAGRTPGTVVTVAGTGREGDRSEEPTWRDDEPPPGPSQIAVGPDGTVYYADTYRHQVGKVTADGKTAIVAGTGENGRAGDGGPAARAELGGPTGVAVGPNGAVYIAETHNQQLRVVSADGVISAVAGVAINGHPLLGQPQLAVDAAGAVFVTNSDDGLVRRVDPNGTVVTVAGGGKQWANKADGGPATAASLTEPSALAVAGDGTVYFVDTYRSAVRAVRPDGILRTVAGDSYRSSNEAGFTGDGGPATAAEINKPAGLAVGPDGSLYVADTFNGRIRRVAPDGVITTVAGTGQPAQEGDGGPATKAALLEPTSVAGDPAGNLYVGSAMGGSIRKIDTAGTITTIARFGEEPAGDSLATETALTYPSGVAVDRAGTVYIGTSSGQTYAVGQDGMLSEFDDVAGSDLATGPDGSLYSLAGGTITRRYPDGATVTLAGGPVREPFPHGQLARTANISGDEIEVGPDGLLYVAGEDQVYRINRKGVLETVIKRAASNIAFGPDGSMYLTEFDRHRVSRVQDGKVTPFAGNGEDIIIDDEDGDGGPAVEAVVRNPGDVAVAGDGTVYVSTTDGIHRVSTDGTINKVLPDESGGALALDAQGNLYFTESQGHRVRVLVRPGELEFPSFGWSTMWFGVNTAVAAWVGVAVVIGYRRPRYGTTARSAPLSGLPLPATGTSAR